ncbi:MAG: hypothetical protein VW495_14305, partial [Rhodobiaceae bacterium]
GGHSLGYMDVKICELHELLDAIESNGNVWPSFADGLVIEKVMDAVDRSFPQRQLGRRVINLYKETCDGR